MGIRIDPTLKSTTVNPPPAGAGGLALHTATPGSNNPAQEVINVTMSAFVNSRPDNSVILPRFVDTNLPSAIIDDGIRFAHRWSTLDSNNHVFGRYVVRHNLNTAVYDVRLHNVGAVISGGGTQRIEFDVLSPVEWRIDIFGPAGSMPDGWFVECMKLSNETAYDNTAVPKHHPSRYFVPEFLTEIEKWKPVQMRFMKAMATEAGTITGIYPHVEGLYSAQFSEGSSYIYPLDVMVSLCNAYDIAPWFNLSGGASVEAITDFATYVRDNLKPSLTVYASCANEYWNGRAYKNTSNRFLWHEVWKKFKTKGTGTVTIDKTARTATFSGAPDIRTLYPGQSILNVVIGDYAYALDMDGRTLNNGTVVYPPATATVAHISSGINDEYLKDEVATDWWYANDGDFMLNESYTIVLVKQGKVWADLFAAVGQRARLIVVWESQLAVVGRFKEVRDSSYWQPFADYIDPFSVIDAVAVNNYFGSATFKEAGFSSTALGANGRPLKLDNAFTTYLRPLAVADDYPAYSAALRDFMLDIPISGVAPSERAIPSYLADNARKWRDTIAPYSNTVTGMRLKLLSYEGGAHIIHDVLDPANRATDQDIIDAYDLGFRYSAEAEEIFRAWAETHIRFYDGPVMQFNFIAPVSRFGAYGLVPFFGGPTDERQDLLFAEYVDRAPWWTDDYPPQCVQPSAQSWTAGVDPGFTLDDWVSNNATVFAGTPPPGMVLDGGTGALTGLPQAGSGSYTFTASNYAGSVEIVIRLQVVS
jgi:hypothetical protein